MSGWGSVARTIRLCPMAGISKKSSWRIWTWRPRFSVRTLVIAMVIVCGTLAALSTNLRRAWRQRRAVAELRELGVTNVFYRYDPQGLGLEDRPLYPRLFQRDVNRGRWYGEEVVTKDFFDDVIFVNASDLERFGLVRASSPIPVAHDARFWRAIAQFPELESLVVADDDIRPSDVRGLERQAKLQGLCLQSPRLSDEHLREVGRLTGLRCLMFGGGVFSFADAEQRGKESRAKVSRQGLEHLWLLPDLEKLDLFGATVDDDAVEPLSRLHALTYLDLGNSPLGDNGLRKLTTLKNLKYINLHVTNVTAAGVTDFQAALPGCRISHPATDLPAPSNPSSADQSTIGGSADSKAQP